ncbi:MAG: hypothetical protein U0800_27190 [Isosphaeraceae bacterium]
MKTITLKELELDPDRVLKRVGAGGWLLISRNGRPIAELRPFSAPRPEPRPFGLAAGTFAVPDDFDSTLPDDIVEAFEGR